MHFFRLKFLGNMLLLEETPLEGEKGGELAAVKSLSTSSSLQRILSACYVLDTIVLKAVNNMDVNVTDPTNVFTMVSSLVNLRPYESTLCSMHSAYCDDSKDVIVVVKKGAGELE